ncbi:MAG: serine/threonine-protein kinase [Myxococcota bacterium]
MDSADGSEGTGDPSADETGTVVVLGSHGTRALEPDRSADPATADDTQEQIGQRVRQRLFEQPFPVTRIGRFTMLEPVGHGGMGTVYAAYDGQLDRKIAVKVLSDQQMPDPKARLRFMREAQALARLSHPNVVTVYEVGDSDGEVFLAMEFIRGQSLKAWIGTQPDWREVLEVLVQAGRGLAAAHAAGLVHRDLKPHNIMRREDGVVKVLDFGLARTMSDESRETLEDHEVSISGSALGSFTRTGTLVGTPAYMSPEQYRGQAADARSDQFSFCVTLYEALYTTRPFAGSTLTELQRSILLGEVATTVPGSNVPHWLHRVVVRGLSPEPAARWPSMAALLEALSRDPSRRRNRWLWGLAGLCALGMGGMALHTWSQARARPCKEAAERLVGVWDATRRDEVKTAILGIGRSYAHEVWDRAQRVLDAYADDWVDMHTEACEATATRGEQSPQLLDLRMRCLHRAAVDLRATVDTLADADAKIVHNAHKLTANLRPLSRCADIEALTAEVEPPPMDEVEAVEAAQVQLALAKSQESAGLYAAAKTALDAAKQTLANVEYGPVKTEVALREGSVLDKLGQFELSEAALIRALELASQHEQKESMIEAAYHLMYVVGTEQKRAEHGLRYWPMAKGLAQGHPEQQAHVQLHHGKLLKEQGKYAEAEAEFRAALSLFERTLGPEHPQIATTHNNIAIALDLQGDHEHAEAEFRTALSGLDQALGSEHPIVATTRNNVGIALRSQGKNEEAEAEFRAALSLLERALGSEHPSIGMAHNNIGMALLARGEHEEAEVEFRAAVSLRQKVLGADHPDVAFSRSNVAVALGRQGKLEEAEVEYRAALVVMNEALGAEHPSVASAHSNLGRNLSDQGKHEEAEVELRAALGILEQTLGPEHPNLILTHNNLGYCLQDQEKYAEAEVELRAALWLLEKHNDPEHLDIAKARNNIAAAMLRQDRAAEALPLAEQAWARFQGDDVPAGNRATSAFVLARILWTVEGRDRARARTLAEEALRSYRAAGPDHGEDIEQVRQWLDSHRAR